MTHQKNAVLAGSIVLMLFLSACSGLNNLNTHERSSSSMEICDVALGKTTADRMVSQVEFSPSDTLYVSFDVRNMTALLLEKDQYYWIRQDIRIQDARGALVMLKPGVIDKKDKVSGKPVKFINEVALKDIGKLKQGRYVLTLLVTDLSGFQTALKRVLFKIT